ncbi:vWA domain-containing protein [Crossiella equi]|uniref:vWA domain-containing protein n=1 Tax=Crossiella equi TaxID=130796 RepID=UPI001178249F|nr:vWA domain-containing protein [Crossiella equi]
MRRIFAAVAPGHGLLITPHPQPSTGYDGHSLHVRFPVTDGLAARFAPGVWARLPVQLRYQMISYFAGHEAMHAHEIVRGYPLREQGTPHALVANVLADIRVDFSSIIQQLAYWSLNRDIAYRILFQPLAPPADLEPEGQPQQDAERLLCWGLALLRSGSLHDSDSNTVDQPTHPSYQRIWPELVSVLTRARGGHWAEEENLATEVLDLLWRSTSTEPEEETGNGETDANGKESEDTSDLQDGQDGQRTAFEQQLLDALHEHPMLAPCAQHVASPLPEHIEAIPAIVADIAHSDMGAEVRQAWEEEKPHHDPLAVALVGATLDTICAYAHQAPALGTQLATVLTPLLHGLAESRRPQPHGPVLDLDHQSARIYLHAHHPSEANPRLWLNPRHRQHRANHLSLAVLVDASGSMTMATNTTAATAHLAASALLYAVHDLNDHANIAMACFDHRLHVVRTMQEPLDPITSQRKLALAQTAGMYTELAPGVAWALDELEHTEGASDHRRLLIILTDDSLEPQDRTAVARHLATAPGDIITIGVGIGVPDPSGLQQLSTTPLILEASSVQEMPQRLNQLIEQHL